MFPRYPGKTDEKSLQQVHIDSYSEAPIVGAPVHGYIGAGSIMAAVRSQMPQSATKTLKAATGEAPRGDMRSMRIRIRRQAKMKSSGFVAMAALFLGFFGLFGSSGRTFHLMPGSMVPAASGTVHVERGKNNPNMNLDIKVKNLALPGSLTPPANEYIVWIEPHGDQPLKQGAIGVDGKLQGELKTQTTAKNFNVVITAERSAAVTSPSGPVILRGHVAD